MRPAGSVFGATGNRLLTCCFDNATGTVTSVSSSQAAICRSDGATMRLITGDVTE